MVLQRVGRSPRRRGNRCSTDCRAPPQASPRAPRRRLRARADYDYRLSLAGDPRGLFGRYPPVQAGWFPDPQNRYQMRYFDGALWTGHALRR